jgi:hypothetical protein
MRGLALSIALLAALAGRADAHCRCHKARPPRCADKTALHRITVEIDLAVADGGVEVITQSGPYRLPAADLDGKLVLFLFTRRGVVFQGFFDDAITIAVGKMTGTRASISTSPLFAAGEYELALFIDVVPGSAGGGIGPQRGDLAAFDNTVCDPTGVTVRVPVGCGDATVRLENRHFIVF